MSMIKEELENTCVRGELNSADVGKRTFNTTHYLKYKYNNIINHAQINTINHFTLLDLSNYSYLNLF